MDPSQWATFDHSTSRLNSPVALPTTLNAGQRLEPAHVNQAGLSIQGAPTLPAPIPAHINVNSQRLSNASMNNQTFPGSHVQILEQVNVANAAQYKSLQTQDLSDGLPLIAHQGSAASALTSTAATPPVAHVSARSSAYEQINAEPSTIQQLLLSGQLTGSHLGQDKVQPSGWSSATAVQSQQTAASSVGAEQIHLVLQEPPPAHSGVRPNSIQKNSYIPKASNRVDYNLHQAVVTRESQDGDVRGTQPAHAADTLRNQLVSAQRTPLSTYKTQEPPAASYNQVLSASQSNHSLTHAPSTQSSNQNYHASVSVQPQIASQPLPSYSPVTSQVMHQTHQQVACSTFANSTASVSNPVTVFNTMMDNKYEAVSPVAPEPPPDPVAQNFNPGMSLQVFADISAIQEKIPLESQVPGGQLVGDMTQQGSQSYQSTLPVLQQQVEHAALRISANAEVDCGTSQVVTAVTMPQVPVQAVADSTTKKGRRASGARKSTGGGSRKRRAAVPNAEEIPVTKSNVSQLLYEGESTYETISAQDLASFGSRNPSFDNAIPLTHEEQVISKGETLFLPNSIGHSFIDQQDVMMAAVVSSEETEQQITYPEITETDEEFSHLAPQANITTTSFTPVPAKPSPSIKTLPKTSGFQDCFLSFLGGKKPETLSSVTNNPNVKKPVLPKYIPDPRPVSRPADPKISPKTDAPKNPTIGSSLSTSVLNKKPAPLANKPNAKSLDSYKGVSGSNVVSKPGVSHQPVNQSKPRTVDNLHSSSVRARVGQGASIRHSAPAKASSYIGSEDNEFSDSDDGVTFIDRPSKGRPRGKIGAGRVKTKKKKREPSPVTPRERTARKAKLKVEEKRQKRMSKTRLRKNISPITISSLKYCQSSFLSSVRKGSGGKEEDSEDSMSEFLSSDEQLTYDSDKDPMWNPYGDPQRGVSSDEERADMKVQVKPKPPAAPSRPHTTGNTKAVDDARLMLLSVNTDLPDDWDQPHSYHKGSFVMDRRDEFRQGVYDIWRVDAGRLLQKYEGFFDVNKLKHRATSTYSSWSESIQRSYKAIGVTHLASSGSSSNVVEVIEKYRPLAADESLEEDSLMQPFTVYIQILVSTALDPEFLPVVQKDQDEYYIQSLKSVDQMLRSKQKNLLESVAWTEKFKSAVDVYPCMVAVPKSNIQATCQASSSGSLKANYVIRLMGDPYNFDTLEKVATLQEPCQFSVSETIVNSARVYHRLRHFKHNLLRHCRVQVTALKPGAADVSDILDQCLQNRAWVHQHFRNMKRLLTENS